MFSYFFANCNVYGQSSTEKEAKLEGKRITLIQGQKIGFYEDLQSNRVTHHLVVGDSVWYIIDFKTAKELEQKFEGKYQELALAPYKSQTYDYAITVKERDVLNKKLQLLHDVYKIFDNQIQNKAKELDKVQTL